MTKKRQGQLAAGVLFIFLIGFSTLLYFVGPEEIVSGLGAENIYIIMFLVALLGGMTSIGAISYVTAMLAFIDGGADPVLIVITAGLGTAIGDSVYYLVSYNARAAITAGWWESKLQQLSRWLQSHSPTVQFIVIYGYLSFTPFPNDVLTISLGLTRIKKHIALPAIWCGTVTFAFILAFLGTSVVDLVL